MVRCVVSIVEWKIGKRNKLKEKKLKRRESVGYKLYVYPTHIQSIHKVYDAA